MQNTVTKAAPISWSILLPLALAQFICSYAATTMNVSISVIAKDLGTDVHAIQITITLFTLTMAALMITGSKLTDIWGRKFCLMLGLIVYGLGALIATFAQGIGLLMFGYSLLEGVGTALLIPPVYILCTVSFLDLPTRARAFGVISAAGGIGAAAGPLIGGVITTTISWRASFALQVLVVALIIVLSRRLADPGVYGAKRKFDIIGTIIRAGDTTHRMVHHADQLRRDLGLPAKGAPLQRHSNRPGAHPNHNRHPDRRGPCGQARAKAYAKKAHLCRFCLNHHRHDPAVALSGSHLKQPRLHSGPSVVRSGSGNDADLLGQRRAVQLSRQRAGGDLRLI